MASRVKSDRRNDLLQATRQVLAQKGLEATKVSDIVAQAGVAQGTFYLYFPSKAAVVAALTQEVFININYRVLQAMQSAGNLWEMVDRGVRAGFDCFDEYQDIHSMLQSGIGHIEKSTDWENYMAPQYQSVAAMIALGQQTGQIQASYNPALVARLVVGSVDRAADDYFLYNPTLDRETYIQTLVQFIYRALKP